MSVSSVARATPGMRPAPMKVDVTSPAIIPNVIPSIMPCISHSLQHNWFLTFHAYKNASRIAMKLTAPAA